MSKIKPMALIESMSGKICQHSDMYFFERNGKVFTGKICNPSTKEPTEAQLAVQEKFKTAHANTQAAIDDPEQLAAYQTAYDAQKKYSTLRGYIFAQEFAKLSN